MDEHTEEILDFKARVAFRIRQLRKSRNLSVRKVCEQLNFHKNSIWNHESGLWHANLYIILKYCKFYNITIVEFLEGIDI